MTKRKKTEELLQQTCKNISPQWFQTFRALLYITLTAHCISTLQHNLTSPAWLIINELNLNCQMNLSMFKYLEPNGACFLFTTVPKTELRPNMEEGTSVNCYQPAAQQHVAV